ncbi:MAG: hypothetical protein Q4B65_02610 [Candidatus Saccharibacteria bacterium]|nr:hypothetical protein [Candidatus Saccharibacteria bacterium]
MEHDYRRIMETRVKHGKTEVLAETFDEFLNNLKVDMAKDGFHRLEQLRAILFEEGHKGIFTVLGLPELKSQSIKEDSLLSIIEDRRKWHSIDSQEYKLARLEETFEKILELIKAIREDARKLSEFEKKKSRLNQQMFSEEAEVFKKYVGLFYETFEGETDKEKQNTDSPKD